MGDIVPNLWEFEFKKEPYFEMNTNIETFIKKENEEDFFISNLPNSVTPITAPIKKARLNFFFQQLKLIFYLNFILK